MAFVAFLFLFLWLQKGIPLFVFVCPTWMFQTRILLVIMAAKNERYNCPRKVYTWCSPMLWHTVRTCVHHFWGNKEGPVFMTSSCPSHRCQYINDPERQDKCISFSFVITQKQVSVRYLALKRVYVESDRDSNISAENNIQSMDKNT